MTPTCPSHGNKNIKGPDERGRYWCAVFVGVGATGANAKGYCSQRLTFAPQTAPTPVPAPAVAVSPPGQPAPSQTPSRASLACAALNAAAMLSNTGTPLEMVIATADRLLHGFLIPASQGRQTTPAPQQDADLAPFS